MKIVRNFEYFMQKRSSQPDYYYLLNAKIEYFALNAKLFEKVYDF